MNNAKKPDIYAKAAAVTKKAFYDLSLGSIEPDDPNEDITAEAAVVVSDIENQLFLLHPALFRKNETTDFYVFSLPDGVKDDATLAKFKNQHSDLPAWAVKSEDYGIFITLGYRLQRHVDELNKRGLREKVLGFYAKLAEVMKAKGFATFEAKDFVEAIKLQSVTFNSKKDNVISFGS